MDEIILKIQEPSFWFEGLFFVILLKLVSLLAKKVPNWLSSWNRSSQAKELKKIKNLRRNSWEVHYQIAIERSLFIVFALVGLFYLVLLVATPLKEVFDKSIIAGLIVMSPVFVIEIIWLKRNSFLKQLLKYAQKIA